MATKGLSVSDYAKQRGISRQAVLKAIGDGRLKKSIEKDANGRYSINPAVANREWLANTSEGMGSATHMQKKDTRPQRENINKSNDVRNKKAAAPAAVVEEPEEGACPRSFNQSRAWREYHNAEKARLECDKLAGTLVAVDEVEHLWARTITEAKTKLMGVPSKAKSRIPRLSLDEIAILEELQREALDGLIAGM